MRRQLREQLCGRLRLLQEFSLELSQLAAQEIAVIGEQKPLLRQAERELPPGSRRIRLLRHGERSAHAALHRLRPAEAARQKRTATLRRLALLQLRRCQQFIQLRIHPITPLSLSVHIVALPGPFCRGNFLFAENGRALFGSENSRSAGRELSLRDFDSQRRRRNCGDVFVFSFSAPTLCGVSSRPSARRTARRARRCAAGAQGSRARSPSPADRSAAAGRTPCSYSARR